VDLVNRESDTGLVGWRCSADGPLLCPFSLLTGDFTGNFAKSRIRERQRLSNVASSQGFRCEFAAQGIILVEQGPIAREQGILLTGIEIIAG
jgi:hypothetical protein